jgi:hypothetical protein
MGAVNTTYTFTATDTVTSGKLNNIIDQTIMTEDAVFTGGTVEVAGGKLKVRSGSITSNELGDGSVVTAKIANEAVITAKIPDSAITTIKLENSTSSTTGVTTAKIADSNVTTAKLANASVTAAKLDGSQSGSAPIYGVRAWVNFNGVGTAVIREKGNVASVTRGSTAGLYTITFPTATPMPDTNYAIVGWARDPTTSSGSACVVTAGPSATKTTTSFQVRTTVGTTQSDSQEVNIMVIR